MKRSGILLLALCFLLWPLPQMEAVAQLRTSGPPYNLTQEEEIYLSAQLDDFASESMRIVWKGRNWTRPIVLSV